MMMKRHTSLVLAALSLTLLSACSTSDESGSTEAEPSFVPSEASTAPTTVTETVEKTQASTEAKGTENGADHGDAGPVDDTPPAGNHTIYAGKIGGDCGYTNQGDTIHAGEHTSCEFTGPIFDEALKHTYTFQQRDPRANGAYSTDISVASPTTGKTYDLRCSIGSDHRGLICGKDGDNSLSAIYHAEEPDRFWTDRLDVVGGSH
ncbi:hypothetical protein [Corynebacterium accolens]|uniref:hypothetical protein n=1 Tax=Corynebacterium accolens TaxID=38284 RepID=UPI00266F3B46|nr:hypothetical protein [Corynebacterium accolens]WKS55877.1 hypothetical protein NLL31_12100 [Corynebacterium accolens]